MERLHRPSGNLEKIRYLLYAVEDGCSAER